MFTLSPVLYWFFLILIIPIIIHLFYFRRIKEIKFPNVTFLRHLIQDNRRSKSLKQLLQLVSRLAFLLFLILAFLDFVYEGSDGQSLKSTVYHLDNSLSSSLKTEDNLEVIAQLTDFINVELDDNQTKGSSLSTNDQLRYKSINSFNIDDRLSNLSFSRSNRDFEELFERISVEKEVNHFVLSDFQNFDLDLELGSNNNEIALNLVHVETSPRSNVYIDSVYLEELFLIPDGLNKVVIRYEVEGIRSTADDVTLKVLNGDFLLATLIVDGNSEDNSISIPIDIASLSSNNLIIEITENGVTYDNKYYLTLPSYEIPKVVHLHNGNKDRYIASVYQNTELFDYSDIDIKAPDYAKLELADLIILDQLEAIPDYLITLVTASCLIVPNKEIFNLSSYESFMGSKLVRLNNATVSKINAESLSQEIFAGAIAPLDNSVGLPEVAVQYQVQGGEWSSSILKDQFSRSILSKHSSEKRNFQQLFFFSFPFEEMYSNLMTHSIFVPLMYGIAFQSVGLQPIYSYRMDDDYLKIPLALQDSKASLSVRKGGMNFVPNYLVNDGNIQIELPPDLSEAGFYQLMSSEDTLLTFALNYEKSESFMDFPTSDELKFWANRHPNVSYLNASTPSQVVEGRVDSKSDLWLYALVLSVFFLICEIIVARLL